MKLHRALPALTIAAIAAGTAALVVLELREPAAMTEADEHSGHEAESGPHGGRLLEAGPFALEVTIFETGLPSEFRLYGYIDGQAVDPSAMTASIELERLGGERETFAFTPEHDYLRGEHAVREPHSFDVRVAARHAGNAYDWRYESHEGRTRISERAAAAAGIAVAPAGPATIVDTVELTGTIQTDPGRVSRVRPRFAGIVTEVRRTIGDRVGADETLATIETNESLRTIAVTAPIPGVVVDRDVQAGQVVGTEPLFVVANLSVVWAQLDVFGDRLGAVRVGQPVSIRTLDGHEIDGEIDWISPLVAHGSQSTQARVRLANADERLRPGQFVRAGVVAASTEVPVAVERTALQRFREFDVVFAKVGETYEVRMLELGRMDEMHAEVLSGLEPGEIYVTSNSYLIKADIEKSGASHDH